VIIYMWLSGLIGSVHTTTSATQVKLEITGASVTEPSNNGEYKVNATVYNPPDSPTTSITVGELEFTNGTMICSNTSGIKVTPPSISPDQSATVYFTCSGPAASPGTPVEVILVTSQGVQVSYTTSVS